MTVNCPENLFEGNPTKKAILEENLNVNLSCYISGKGCGFTGRLKDYHVDVFQQGKSEVILAVRCPKCFSHLGNMVVGKEHTEESLLITLKDYMNPNLKYRGK